MPNNPSTPSYPLLMTRPKGASERFVAALPQHVRDRVMPLISPLLDIQPTGAPVPMQDDDAAIFTSSNGVAFGPDGNGRTAFCLGERTTQSAIERGWDARTVGATADELVAELTQNRPNHKLIHLSGVHTRGNVAARLRASKLNAQAIAVYHQHLLPLTNEATTVLTGGTPVLVPLFSPRTAIQFFADAPTMSNAIILAISAAVADTSPHSLRPNIQIANAPNAAAMGDALECALDALPSG